MRKRRKAEQTGKEEEGAEDSVLQREQKTEVTGELLVFQDRGVKKGRGGGVSWRNQRGTSYSGRGGVCIDWEQGLTEEVQLS